MPSIEDKLMTASQIKEVTDTKMNKDFSNSDVNPSALTNLGSTSADNLLKASPRPGVTGTLPVANGGTGATTAAAARTNLDVYSKSETNSAIAQNTTTIYNYSGSNSLLIFRVGRLAQIVAYGTKETTSGTGGDVIGTITEPAFRPVSRVFQESTVYDGHSYVECVVEVNLNGNVCIRRADNAVVAGYQPQYLRLVGLTYICNGA